MIWPSCSELPSSSSGPIAPRDAHKCGARIDADLRHGLPGVHYQRVLQFIPEVGRLRREIRCGQLASGASSEETLSGHTA